MTETAPELVADPQPEESQAPEAVDDTVPCPACHQPVRLSLLADKYAADVPSKYQRRAGRKDEG